MKVMYPLLEFEIKKRGIKTKAIYEELGISARSLYNKRHGVVPFTWPEVNKIQEVFFPDMSKDDLFSQCGKASYRPS